MLNEFRKIFSEFHVKILFLIIILTSIVVSIAPIRSFSVINSNNNTIHTNSITGVAAIKILKEQYNNSKGELTTNRINEVLKYYKSDPDSESSLVKTDTKYPGIFDMLSSAYSTSDSDVYKNLYKIKNADNFYSQNVRILKDTLNESQNAYKTWEKDLILKKANSIKKPFVVNFSRPFENIYKSLMIAAIIISISAIIIGSKLFSYEKEKRMNLIISTFGRGKLKYIGINKVFALLFLLTIEYVISVLLISIITFSITGIDAWFSQIQIKYFTSIYNLTFGSAYLLFIFIGWISILAIGSLTAAVNSILQRSYLSLIIGFILTYLPLVILRFGFISLPLKKFLTTQPVNGFMIIKDMDSLQVFKFGSLKYLLTTSIILWDFIILIVCIVISTVFFTFRVKRS